MVTNDIENVKRQVRLKEWALQVQAQQESGLNATAWCKFNGVKTSTFFSRLRCIREEALKNSDALKYNSILPVVTPTFSEIDIVKMKSPSDETETNSIIVNLNGAAIEIPSNAQVELIASVLRVVKEL